MDNDNLKQDYELLGLPENASREELEKVFDILLRKSRSRHPSPGEAEDIERKIQAYKRIVETEEQRKIAELNQKRYAKWGKLAGSAEKVDDFFRLYRAHVIIGLIAVVAIIFGTNAYLDHREEQKRLAALPPIDLSIMMVGNFMTDDQNGGVDALEQAMTAQIPGFKRVEIENVYLPPQGEAGMSTADIAYQQKAMAVIASTSPDIYITDTPTFDWLSNGGAFLSLDDVASGELKDLLTDETIVTDVSDEDNTEHVYGIKITDSTLVKDLPLGMTDMIVSLRGDTKNKDKAVQMMKEYLENIPKAAE
ncbi:molecular chaperone DnaJ [Paenibacillus sp. MBLB2552]|uniref:Molecular chaperone DnaJ n=1 Tax=Paenibacillus mellifer TaxID=2937794 RepID=A0A9X1Y1J2_9BACL|nr:molecular chaperone DnaJ [Paenibacillus mellifer]MCK8487643.1 molecular chaperone DnaJ [Paenibacillus mellifer]